MLSNGIEILNYHSNTEPATINTCENNENLRKKLKDMEKKQRNKAIPPYLRKCERLAVGGGRKNQVPSHLEVSWNTATHKSCISRWVFHYKTSSYWVPPWLWKPPFGACKKVRKSFCCHRAPKEVGHGVSGDSGVRSLTCCNFFFWAKPRFLHMFPPKNVMKTVPRADDPSTSTTQMMLGKPSWTCGVCFGSLGSCGSCGALASRLRVTGFYGKVTTNHGISPLMEISP